MFESNETVVKALANLAGFVTRKEGRKFLQLTQGYSGQSLKPVNDNDPDLTSLYIHIPFCRSLCPFCCFNRYLLDEEKARIYYRNLKKEVLLYIEKGFKFSSFYFGGGTPTVLIDELVDFIGFLRQHFDVKQISMESTHREINPQNIKLLQEAGVNRLSIGVQSFDDDLLKSMGRLVGGGEEAKEKFLMAQGKFDTVNADFIFNFPTQTIGQLEEDIEAFKEMGIDQATFYPLMPSPHKRNRMERRFNRVDTSREKDFYNIILRELYRDGYKASTAWCFSHGDRMIDEYIIDYDDYIGVGAGSVGFLDGSFLVNTFSLEKYNDIISHGNLPIVSWRKLSDRDNYRYYMLTKLFGMKLDPDKFYQRFNEDMGRKLMWELLFFKNFGLVKSNGQLEVTDAGMYAACTMMKEFFAALNGLREHYIENQI